jgi:hypothetical protein
MSTVDAALALGDLDPSRLGVTGASYGGYETNGDHSSSSLVCGGRHRTQCHSSNVLLRYWRYRLILGGGRLWLAVGTGGLLSGTFARDPCRVCTARPSESSPQKTAIAAQSPRAGSILYLAQENVAVRQLSQTRLRVDRALGTGRACGIGWLDTLSTSAAAAARATPRQSRSGGR